jgi:hypothetical protein
MLSIEGPRDFWHQLKVFYKQAGNSSEKIDLYKEFENFFINYLNIGAVSVYDEGL